MIGRSAGSVKSNALASEGDICGINWTLADGAISSKLLLPSTPSALVVSRAVAILDVQRQQLRPGREGRTAAGCTAGCRHGASHLRSAAGSLPRPGTQT